MTAQVIERDLLGVLTKIGQGGQGVVYRAPNVKTKFAASMVFKEYKTQVLADIDFTALAAMPALVEDSMSDAQAERLISVAAWPCAIIEKNGVPTGFVMPTIGEEFFIPLTTVKGVSDNSAEFQHLLNHSSVLAARGITINDAQRYSLLREVASGLAFLHRFGVCVGDISPKNLLFSLTPREAVYFIDCDAMRINGVSVLPQVETPGWQAPGGEELATIYSDTYKLALLALRLLAGDHDIRSPEHLPSTTPDMLRQIITDALTNQPHQRPLPEVWTYVLGHAIEEAQHLQKSAASVGVPLAAPETPVVRSRPTARSAPPARPRSTPPAPGEPTSARTQIWVAAAVFVAILVTLGVIVALVNHNTGAPSSAPETSVTTQPSVTTQATAPPPPAPPAPAIPPSPLPAGAQITYSVTGTKAPFDQITITYTDASGVRRVLPNQYIPWTMTVTPISMSEVGSIEASSLLRLSKLNCSITRSDGTVISSNQNNAPQANC
jgi:eukaryotic-like serine/threonine-protein kinase